MTKYFKGPEEVTRLLSESQFGIPNIGALNTPSRPAPTSQEDDEETDPMPTASAGRKAAAVVPGQKTGATPTQHQADPAARFGVFGQNRARGNEPRALAPSEPWPTPANSDFSVGRLLKGIVTGDFKDAEIERAMASEGTGSSGGFLVPAPAIGRLIDLARNQSVAVKAGALTMRMNAPEMTVPKVLTDPAAHWRGENQAIPSSAPTFGAVHLKAKTLACLVRVSYELLADAVNMPAVLEMLMARSIATELDRVVLMGDGTASEPRGLFHAPAVHEITMGVNGGTFSDYDPWLDAIQAIEDANGVAVAGIMSPRTKTALAKRKTGLASDKTTLVPPEEYRALRKFSTNQIPNDLEHGTSDEASVAFVGDFSNILIGALEDLRISTFEAGTTAGFDHDAAESMEIIIRAHIRADVAVLRPTHFTKITGII